MTPFKDLPAAQIGLLGEKFVGRLLRSKPGVGVIATLKFSGENDNEAPSLEFDDRRITLADYDVSMKGRTFSLEAKTYKAPAPNREHRCLVHGVPVRKFNEYCKQEAERGIPVYLGVLEVDSGIFLVSDEPISRIAPKYSCGCDGCKSAGTCDFRLRWGSDYPQWYFRRDSFHEWARLDGEDLSRLQREHGRVSHAIRKHVDNGQAPKAMSVPWTWACLPCNVTGDGDSSRHRCEDIQSWRRAFWIQKLRWAMSSVEEIARIVDQPIDRTHLAELLGSQWLPKDGELDPAQGCR